MARATVGNAALSNAGSDLFPTAGDSVNGHVFSHSKTRVLAVYNGSGAPINVTVDTPDTGTSDGLPITVGQRVVAVPAGAGRLIDTRSKAYRQATGNVHVDLSASTSVKLGTVDITQAGE